MSEKDEKPTLDLESLAAHIEREEADYGEDGHVCIALPLAKDVLAALERAERVEAAARAVLLDCEQDESGFVTLPSDSLAELEAALAAAPAINANAYHGPLSAAFQQREKVAELDESGFEPDGGDLCEECEKTLAWRPVGWWVAELESRFPGLRVVRREQAAAPAEEGGGG